MSPSRSTERRPSAYRAGTFGWAKQLLGPFGTGKQLGITLGRRLAWGITGRCQGAGATPMRCGVAKVLGLRQGSSGARPCRMMYWRRCSCARIHFLRGRKDGRERKGGVTSGIRAAEGGFGGGGRICATRGWISVDRGSKATLPLTMPRRVFKSSAKDSARRPFGIALKGGRPRHVRRGGLAGGTGPWGTSPYCGSVGERRALAPHH